MNIPRWGLAALALSVLASDLATENVTLSTFLPAPSGVYKKMLTTGSAYLARDADGRVGIGTSNPSAKLEVAQAIRFGASRGDLSLLNGNPAIGSNGAYPLLLAVNGSERARVSVLGNVGIGTTSPATKLEIDGTLSFTSSGGGYAKICQDVAYTAGAFNPCPANSTPMRMTTAYWCDVAGEAQPCDYPAEGTMRCCKIAP